MPVQGDHLPILLDQMHDQNEIILKRNPDSEEMWSLFEDREHIFSDEITHICICEMR